MTPPVPYVNQIDSAPRHNECGVACVLMLSRWNGKGIDSTVTQLSIKYDPTDDGTTAANLSQALKDFGLTPIPGTLTGYPYIELVQYARLPKKFDPNGNFLHWIVRLSDTTYHDPYWRGTDGATLTTTKAILDTAEQSISSRVGIKEIPKDTMTKVNATVLVDVRLRTGPEVSDATWTNIGLLAGNKISGELVAGGFVKFKDDKYAIYDRNKVKQEFGYVVSDYGGIKYLAVTPIEEPRPPAPSGFKLGVSVLNAHHLLEPAYQAGIRAFLIMDGGAAAVNFKKAHPDAIVMYRRYYGGRGIPDPNSFAAEAGMGNGIVFVSPLNECDAWCYGTASEIEARAKFDTQLAQMCKAKGTVYAAGGFSMGTPDFTRADICDAMRKFYAPGYNSGLFGMNMHTYSPTMGWIYGSQQGINRQFVLRDDDGAEVSAYVGRDGHIATYHSVYNKRVLPDPIGQRIWFERRWEWLFDSCGFNPDPNLLGIYSDETGVDEGGVGGFPAHGAGDAEIERWSREYKSLSLLPLNGGPSVMRGAVIFQAGDNVKWNGYNTQGNFAAIARANQ